MNKKMDNLKSLIAKRRARFQSARPVRQSAAPKAVSPKQPEAPVAPVEAPAEIPETPVAPAEIPETPAVPETPVVEVTEAPAEEAPVAEEVAAPVEEAPVAEESPAAETDVFGRSVKKRRSRKVKEVEENG